MSGLAATATGDARPLDRRRVYIFLSRAGVTLGLMLGIILLGAINYDNALAYLLSFLLGGLVMVAMLHTYRNLAGLRLLGSRAAPVFAGDIAEFECVVDNTTARPHLDVAIKRWPQHASREQRRYLARFENRFSVAADDSVTVSVAVEANRRGWLALDRVMLHTHYPLGILRAWAFFECDAVALVYPAPRGELALPQARLGARGAATPSNLGADDFAGLRPYSPGDPVRAIAWKTLAKAQDVMIKRFHGQTSAELALTWSAAAPAGGTEARLSQLTVWVLAAERSGASYALELPGESIALGHGPGHRERCLRALALFEPLR